MSSGKRAIFSTRMGFYLIAIGSAFGLGNLWRFPYVIVENGGGAFVLLYIGLAFFIGSALIISELMLGKLTRRSAMVAVDYVTGKDPDLSAEKPTARFFSIIPKRFWKPIAALAVIAAFALLIYYAVIAGWVLHYIMQMLVGQLKGQSFSPEETLLSLRDNSILQVALMSVHFILASYAVVKGVKAGVERWISVIIPLFISILIILVIKTLDLPTSGEALRYMFYPDFSKIGLNSLLEAVGHVCFSLSIGFGTMVTFGSYLRDETHIPSAGFRVASIDTVISLMSLLLIFPLVVGATFAVSGPELVFQTLPRLFLSLSGGMVFGVFFFICLYLSTLAASIGLMESVVSNIIDWKKFERKKAAIVVGSAAMALSIFPALTSGIYRSVTFQGKTFLEVLDTLLVNGILPLLALLLSSCLVYWLKEERKRQEFIIDDQISADRLFNHWQVVVVYIAPIVILSAIVLGLISLFV